MPIKFYNLFINAHLFLFYNYGLTTTTKDVQQNGGSSYCPFAGG